MGTPCPRASSTALSISTLAPEAAISSISSYETTVELARLRNDARIGGEDSFDVRVDLAGGAERRSEGDRGRVGPTAPERRHVHRVPREALESRDQHDPSAIERLEHPHGRDLADLRLRVHRVGEDPGLRAGERDGLVTEVVHRHRDERAGDSLSGREQHVELAGVRVGRRRAGQLEQRVGRLAHRGDRSHDAHAPLARLDEPPRDVPDLLGVGDRGAAELHDDGLRGGLGRRVHGRDCGWLVGAIVAACRAR